MFTDDYATEVHVPGIRYDYYFIHTNCPLYYNIINIFPGNVEKFNY